MHSQHPGIQHTFKVFIDEKHFVTFFIFDTQEHMLAATPDEGEYFGKCHTTWFAEVETRSDRKAGPKFGEIVLYEGRIGVGIVAHEIQHLINSWMEFRELSTDTDDELIAAIAEKVTVEFWNQYYERYPRA